MMDALGCGQRGEFIRSFVDEGPCALSVLRETVDALPDTHEDRRAYGMKIIESFGEGSGSAPGAVASEDARDDTHTEALSEREIEIVKLSADNLDTREIGHALGLSEGTVKWYWQRIFSKLHVHKRAHAVRLARRHGLLH
jgi:LuxR family maltose regulon positive regulatory protein